MMRSGLTAPKTCKEGAALLENVSLLNFSFVAGRAES